jgi:hypothetical protein
LSRASSNGSIHYGHAEHILYDHSTLDFAFFSFITGGNVVGLEALCTMPDATNNKNNKSLLSFVD